MISQLISASKISFNSDDSWERERERDTYFLWWVEGSSLVFLLFSICSCRMIRLLLRLVYHSWWIKTAKRENTLIMHASPSHNYISMLEFRQFVVALNGKSYRDTKHIDNGFSPPKHGSIAAPWKMSTVWGCFFFNGEYKIRRVESVTKNRNIQPANLLSLTTI